MNSDIVNAARGCQQCQVHLRSLAKEPLQPTSASRPFERVGADILDSGGKHYLCLIDRFSGFPFALQLSSMTCAAVIKALNKVFMDFGYPKTIRTDNGLAFGHDFGVYCKSHGIKHETSSPHFHQSNGHAESGVKVCKHLLQKCNGKWTDFLQALMEW